MLNAPRMPFSGEQFSLGSGWGGPSWSPPKVEGSVLEVSAAKHKNQERGGAGDGWGLLFHTSAGRTHAKSPAGGRCRTHSP